MSKPRKADRPSWLAERQQQAAAAAIDGHGWVYMANLWDCSTPAALQWSRENIDPDVCRQIALNGYNKRQGRHYRQEERSKPHSDKPKRQSNGRVYWRECQHILYIDGKTEMCGADTINGHHACDRCKKRESASEGFRLRDLRLVQY